ncbi:MAG TPA: DUF1249 domain-containing protein [Pseudomonadales bacterium]|nr:DUF1249 domain-containing protein [Pseudomonadales bacterium]
MGSMKKKRRYVPDLVADMAECDANYIRLNRLFPHMDKEDYLEFGVDSASRATVQGTTVDGAVVTMKIEQRCPYTTMRTVIVTNEEDKPWVKWPTLEVRVYHDIKSAEVKSFERHRNLKFRYPTPNENMFQPDEKSQINKYFGELLKFCYEYGHSLEAVTLK